MNEFVEALSLTEHGHVFAVTMGHTSEERVHVKVVDQTGLLTLAGCRKHVATVGVKQGGETTHKCCSHLVGSEGNRANYAHRGSTTTMNSDVTACELLASSSLVHGLAYQSI